MHYTYKLQSLTTPNKTYIGYTANLKRRFQEHNLGKSPHTKNHIPWKMIFYIALSDESKAKSFEVYLKSGAGREFTRKHF